MLIHLGYLAYNRDTNRCYIPNNEVRVFLFYVFKIPLDNLIDQIKRKHLATENLPQLKNNTGLKLNIFPDFLANFKINMYLCRKNAIIMEAIMSMESIYRMLSSLTDSNKRWLADHLYEDLGETKRRVRKLTLTDEELAEKLSEFPDWNSREHADLSSVDYSQYKPYSSTKTKEIISKWL